MSFLRRLLKIYKIEVFFYYFLCLFISFQDNYAETDAKKLGLTFKIAPLATSSEMRPYEIYLLFMRMLASESC